MGNCVFKRLLKGSFTKDQPDKMIVKVVTPNGGVMELNAPVTADCITNEFPGHAIYRTNQYSQEPLLYNENLDAGSVYYLLPINATALPISTPYRMYFGYNRYSPNRRNKMEPLKWLPEVNHWGMLPRHSRRKGVWKVKLVISPEHLAAIFGQDARTGALIESVRTVAKCGGGGSGGGGGGGNSSYGVSSVDNSDQCSVSSSRKASYVKYNTSSG